MKDNFDIFFRRKPALMLVSLKSDFDNVAAINFRVDDIQDMYEHLKINNVEIISEIQEYDYGKFMQFKDPFGNTIELWEANEEAYIKMVEEEVKSYKAKNQ